LKFAARRLASLMAASYALLRGSVLQFGEIGGEKL
jgi:hypothetical protein